MSELILAEYPPTLSLVDHAPALDHPPTLVATSTPPSSAMCPLFLSSSSPCCQLTSDAGHLFSHHPLGTVRRCVVVVVIVRNQDNDFRSRRLYMVRFCQQSFDFHCTLGRSGPSFVRSLVFLLSSASLLYILIFYFYLRPLLNVPASDAIFTNPSPSGFILLQMQR